MRPLEVLTVPEFANWIPNQDKLAFDKKVRCERFDLQNDL